jgi:polyphenol oxidase
MWSIEQSALGRIVVPPSVPPGFAVFCTTIDYPGRIVAGDLTSLIHQRFGLQTSLTTCRQVHSATVVRGQREESWRECDSCDALWTDEKQSALGIKVADCLPIALIDASRGVIANVHSGWRGAAQRITAAALDAAPLDPSATLAYLGPSIRQCCFEVGDEVATQFDAAFVDRSRPKAHLDLVAFTTALLRERGVTQIDDSGLCTRCEGSIFHSYRRQGPNGERNLMLVCQ